MHNIVFVAVVNAGQNLFHEDCGILLGEFASGNDLIEELTSFADPIELQSPKKYTQSQYSISSHPRRTHTSSQYLDDPNRKIINKFKDIFESRTGIEECTYQLTQDIDFIKEHFLLIIVHVALSQNLHCSLGTCLSVHTHPHLSEST
jgi:hypothetical protein